MYTLYVSKSEKKLEVKKAKKVLQNLEYRDHVTRYNNCYYICLKRAPLMEKAKEIKNNWITELEEELNALKAIEIK